MFFSGSVGFCPSIGEQRLAADLVPALEQRGYQHLVVTTQRDGDGSPLTHYGKIPVHRISFGNAWTSVDRLTHVRQRVAQLKRSFAPDLIHLYGLSPSNSFHHLTTHVHPAPVAVSLHSEYLPLAERTLKNATWVVACSQALLQAAQTLVPEIISRSSVIYNGREQPPFAPRSLSADSPRLLCVGRLAPEKGFDVALSAFARIHARFPTARLIIAGDGAQKENLRRQIEELDLSDRVELIGWVPQDETFRLFLPFRALATLLGKSQKNLPSSGDTMTLPLISCIVPVFNGERYVREALDSIFAQTYPRFEVIVVNDGSTDGTATIVAGFGDRVCSLWQPNQGPATARNLGLDIAHGDYVAFLDADDLWHPEKLQRQLTRFFGRVELDYCVVHAQNFWIPELSEESDKFRDHRIAKAMPAYVTGSLMVRRELLTRIGFFDPSLGHGDSMEWFLRATEHGAVGELIPEVLLYRRLHHTNRVRQLAAASRNEFLQIIKASLDRRRQSNRNC